MADRVESVSRRTGGFVCSISGSAAPVWRLWVQSSAQLHTASARARGLHSFAPSAHRRPRHAPTLGATLRCGGALAKAHGSYCHHPHGVRTRASTTRGIGKRARDDLPTARTAAAFASDSAHVCRVGSERRCRSGRRQIVTGSFADAPCGGGARAHAVRVVAIAAVRFCESAAAAESRAERRRVARPTMSRRCKRV